MSYIVISNTAISQVGSIQVSSLINRTSYVLDIAIT